MTDGAVSLQSANTLSDPEESSEAAATPATALTDAAFAGFRTSRVPRLPNPLVIKNSDELDPMPDDEMSFWRDGIGTGTAKGAPEPLGDAWLKKERLWAVRATDVVHSAKHCAFGSARARGEITHTNLTGGKEAFVGGELMLVDENTVIINGDSGRYGTKDDAETEEVARAFAASGWETYWVGMDEDLGRPAPIVGTPLRRVA